MEKLKVGDVIYCVGNKLGSIKNYHVDKVVKLTKTQAITEGGRKIRNKPSTFYGRDGVSFEEITGSQWHFVYWSPMTDSVKAEIELNKERRKAYLWFTEKKFTIDEMMELYKQFEGK